MQRFKNILFVNHPGADSSRAFNRAATLALENEARLRVIEVHTTVTPTEESDNEQLSHSALLEATRCTRLKELDRMLAPYGDQLSATTDILFGMPFIEIIMEVQRHGHDLVVLAPDKKGIGTAIFGSTHMHLLRKCPCPVWIVKADETSHFKRIMAAVDIGVSDSRKEELNGKILELASSLALAESSELHVVHAWSAPYANLSAFNEQLSAGYASEGWINDVRSAHGVWLNELIKRFSGHHEIEPVAHLLQGAAADAIPEQAQKLGIDLVVMGTVARTGIAGFFIGNTAESIISQLDCSLLAVKPEGFDCPIKLDEDRPDTAN